MRRTWLAIAAVPAAAATTLAVSAISGAQGQAQGGEKTLVLYENGKGNTLKVVDNKPFARKGHRVSVGDQILVSASLQDASGAGAGRIMLSCQYVRSTKPPLMCQGAATLKDGTLTLAGILPEDAETNVLAITGGTGAYDGAHGTATSVTKDGTDTDTFTYRT